MKSILKKLVFLSLLLLLLGGAEAQDTLSRASTPQGGRWLIKSGLANFVSAGQPSAATSLESEDGVWAGSVGFLFPEITIGQNNAPVAFANDVAIFIADSLIQLEGFDPDNDPITYQVVTDPTLGTVAEIEDGLLRFTPSVGLNPGELYNDELTFNVSDGALTSENETVAFQFILEDVAHEISGLSFSSGELALDWSDAVPNEEYAVEIEYYDLSDVANPTFRTLISSSFLAEDLSSSDDEFSLSTAVDEATDPYLFDGDQIFVTASVVAPNGVGAFEAFVIDNTAGARVSTSDDGQFFAFGGDQTVRENGEVEVRFYGVELGDFDISTSIIEILDNGELGTLSTATEKETGEFVKEWFAVYEATEEVGGLDSIQFRVFNQDRQLFDTAWVEIEVFDVNDPPRLDPIASQVTQEDTPLTVAIEPIDPDNEVSVLVQSNENTLVPATYADGIITISPSNDFFGLVSISVVVTEVDTEEEYVAFRRFDVEVLDVDDSPVVAEIPNATIEEDNSLTFIATATDADATLAVFSYSVEVSDPSSLEVSISDGTITITPLSNVNGTFEISVFANDGLGNPTSVSVAETFTLEVTPVNDAPEIIQTFVTQRIVAGFPDYTIDLSAYFNDVESGSDLTYSFSGNTEIALSEEEGILTVAPSDNFNAVEDVTITASDGEFEVSQTIAFVFVQTAANIVVEDIDNVLLSEDFITSTLDISDVFQDLNDPNAVFEYSLTGGGFITATVSAEGVITFESETDFFGTETFFLFGSVASQANFVSFDVEVSPVNDTPILGEIADAEVNEDSELSGVFLSASDVDNTLDELTVSFSSSDETVVEASAISSSVLGGGFTINLNPIANANGSSTIVSTVTDGTASQEVSFIVTVLPVNDVPVAQVTTITSATEDVAYTLDIETLFSDVDGDILVYSVSEKPDWLTLSNSNLSGTPLNENVGTSNISIRVDDSNGGIISQSYSLEVINVNDAPSLIQTFVDLQLLEDFGSTTLDLSEFYLDDDGDALTFTAVSSNTESVTTSVDGNSLVLSEVGNGTSNITVEANDGNGGVLAASFSVTVTNVNDAPIVASEIDDQELAGGFSTSSFDLSGLFTDEDGDAFTYEVSSSDQSVVTVAVSGSELTLTEVGVGTAVISVTALDGNGGQASFEFSVTVNIPALGVEDEIELIVYPNPAREFMYIRGDYQSIKWKLIDVSGKSILSAETANGDRIDISSVPVGLYYLISDENDKPLKMLITK